MGRVIQFTPTLSYGDAVSNDVFAMHDVLRGMGKDSLIVTIATGKKIRGNVVLFGDFSPLPDDIFIYHMSIGSPLSDFVAKADVKRKIMVWHNITPAHFFEGISPLAESCRQGREELVRLRDCIDFAICDSEYNKQELDELGYRETAVLPIVFDKSEYLETAPTEEIIKKYSDGKKNILFVGRIAPNKKQEDIIKSFCLYNRYINPESRLFLVGAVVATEKYKEAIDSFIDSNGIKNVYFSGHVSFPDILAYYRTADLFLCESEHEGFCVPLLEAMTFDVPVLAYDSCAVPYTLGNSGMVFTEKDHPVIAELMNLILTDDGIREKMKQSQRKRLDDFDIEKTKESFGEMITPWLA